MLASPWLFGPGGQAGSSDALAKTAFVQEILFEAAELLVEQIVGELDETDHHIGGDGRVGVLDAFRPLASFLSLCDWAQT